MGLDQYLHCKVYVGAKYHKTRGNIKVSKRYLVSGNDDFKDYTTYPSKNISSIIYEVGYWRKSNWIHKWFVDNVQGGEDNCEEYKVSKEQLLELKGICVELLKTKDTGLAQIKLPPQSGFFFGATSENDYEDFWQEYWEDLKYTIKIVDDALAFAEKYEGHLYYQSSW